MSQWEKEFSRIRLIIMAVYSSVFVYAVLVYLRVPFIPYVWERTQQMIFFALLVAVLLVFIASALMGKRIMSPENLAERFHAAGGGDVGLNAAVSLTRSGAIIVAAIGEACAIYGLVLYFLSGDTTRPIIFFVLSILHYPVTMMRVSKAREEVEKLSRS